MPPVQGMKIYCATAGIQATRLLTVVAMGYGHTRRNLRSAGERLPFPRRRWQFPEQQLCPSARM